MIYHCPTCNKQVTKESFGYPVCCGSTMRQGKSPFISGAKSNAVLWDLVKELDAYAGVNDVSDWELNFISDMHDKMILKEGYVGQQSLHITRLWEKYCA